MYAGPAQHWWRQHCLKLLGYTEGSPNRCCQLQPCPLCFARKAPQRPPSSCPQCMCARAPRTTAWACLSPCSPSLPAHSSCMQALHHDTALPSSSTQEPPQSFRTQVTPVPAGSHPRVMSAPAYWQGTSPLPLPGQHQQQGTSPLPLPGQHQQQGTSPLPLPNQHQQQGTSPLPLPGQHQQQGPFRGPQQGGRGRRQQWAQPQWAQQGQQPNGHGWPQQLLDPNQVQAFWQQHQQQQQHQAAGWQGPEHGGHQWHGRGGGGAYGGNGRQGASLQSLLAPSDGLTR